MSLRCIAHWLAVWKWRARWLCHHGIGCCQHVDRPNCNNPSAPKGRIMSNDPSNPFGNQWWLVPIIAIGALIAAPFAWLKKKLTSG